MISELSPDNSWSSALGTESLPPLQTLNSVDICIYSDTGIQHKKTTAAFSVYPSPSIHAGVLSLNAGVVVPFDTVTVDSMHRFNTDEYHYTCPTTGTYYFSLCINLGRK